jgi:hypothetical protein
MYFRSRVQFPDVTTARAGVHRGDEGEAGGVGVSGDGAGEGDEPVLDGLAEGFEGIAAELGQLVQEEDAVVGEAHLSRAGETTVVPRLPPPKRPVSEIE